MIKMVKIDVEQTGIREIVAAAVPVYFRYSAHASHVRARRCRI